MGRLAGLAGDWPLALEGYASAVQLGALLASRSFGWADQEQRLRAVTGVGREAAAAALQGERVDAAIELSELGRGLLFSQVLDAHTDLTGLEAAPRRWPRSLSGCGTSQSPRPAERGRVFERRGA
jgi:hypothetical protein